MLLLLYLMLQGFKSPDDHLPEIRLDHLNRLTDQTGVFEFADGIRPLVENGYCVEDVARALAAVYMVDSLVKAPEADRLKAVYWNYIRTVRLPDGRFHHRLSHDLFVSQRIAEGDAYGRLLWGLGCMIAHEKSDVLVQEATRYFDQSLPYLKRFILPHPRAASYAIQGICYYLARYPSNMNARKYLHLLCRFLCREFELNSEGSWNWFQDQATYDNGRIPLALFLGYELTGELEYLQTAEKSLNFLIRYNFKGAGDFLSVIGNQGWLKKSGVAADFDQQPIDASAMVEACAKAYQILQDERYRVYAVVSFEWFSGRNVLGAMLYDDRSGGCRDGLTRNGANTNQGAESTIMYLIARCTIQTLNARNSR